MTPKETGMPEKTSGPRLPKLRLFVADDLGEEVTITLSQEQSHYLANVMRADAGSSMRRHSSPERWNRTATSIF